MIHLYIPKGLAKNKQTNKQTKKKKNLQLDTERTQQRFPLLPISRDRVWNLSPAYLDSKITVHGDCSH